MQSIESNGDTVTSHNKDKSFFSLIQIIFGTVYGASFLLSFFILNSGTSVVESLVFLFFEFMGSSYTLCGFTTTVTVLFEIPIFQYGDFLLKNLGSGKMLIIACLAYVTRVFGYTLIPRNHIALVLLLEPLHGVTYAFSQLSVVEFFARHTPPGYEARGQGILSLVRGLASFIGLSVGGWSEQTYGPVIMYRGFATAVSFAILQFFVSEKFANKTSTIIKNADHDGFTSAGEETIPLSQK